jgi:hypothetical protein
MSKDEHQALPQKQELSETWQELLGYKQMDKAEAPSQEELPALSEDPWIELAHAQGTEVVDLQAIHLQVSDQDVEQALQVMQEQPAQDVGQDHQQSSKKDC